jgi:hypothetical protein
VIKSASEDGPVVVSKAAVTASSFEHFNRNADERHPPSVRGDVAFSGIISLFFLSDNLKPADLSDKCRAQLAQPAKVLCGLACAPLEHNYLIEKEFHHGREEAIRPSDPWRRCEEGTRIGRQPRSQHRDPQAPADGRQGARNHA